MQTHPGNFPRFTLLQELEEIVNRNPRLLYEDPRDYDILAAGDQEIMNSSVTTMRHTYMAQAIGGAMAQSASNHVNYVYSQAKVALDTHLQVDKIQVKTREIERSS